MASGPKAIEEGEGKGEREGGRGSENRPMGRAVEQGMQATVSGAPSLRVPGRNGHFAGGCAREGLRFNCCQPGVGAASARLPPAPKLDALDADHIAQHILAEVAGDWPLIIYAGEFPPLKSMPYSPAGRQPHVRCTDPHNRLSFPLENFCAAEMGLPQSHARDAH